MSVDGLLSFLAARGAAPLSPAAPARSVRPTADELRGELGIGVAEDDGLHAVLVVREAPRLGARVSSDPEDRLRRYLESRNLRARAPTGRIVFATDHFQLDAFTESDAERFAPVYNFATPVVQTSSASGRGPRLYQYQGSLLSSLIEGSGYAEFRAGWAQWLRATALVGGEARREIPYVVDLTYRDQTRRGYPVSVQFDLSAAHPSRVGFGWSMFVTHEATGSVEPATRPATPRAPSPADEVAPDAVPAIDREFLA